MHCQSVESSDGSHVGQKLDVRAEQDMRDKEELERSPAEGADARTP